MANRDAIRFPSRTSITRKQIIGSRNTGGTFRDASRQLGSYRDENRLAWGTAPAISTTTAAWTSSSATSTSRLCCRARRYRPTLIGVSLQAGDTRMWRKVELLRPRF